MDPTAQAVLAASASFFLVTLIFALICFLCRKQNHRTQTQTQTITTPARQDSSALTTITVTESASFDPSLHRISMPELLVATKNFSPDGIIGDGSFGLVYKAQLSNGVAVAVKKLSRDAFQGFREFQAEMETLGKKKIRHPNLVRILGYCVSGHDRILIYEFIKNGSLDQWIHPDDSYSNSNSSSITICHHPLSWDTRVNIIKGVAKGLMFLHTLDTPIIHRDIKASNVLLDSEFDAHIADFGLARRVELCHSHVSTQVAGTMGYMPPEYKNGLAATVKADVYSFGILMIEIATAKRPNWPIEGVMDNGKEVGLVEWAHMMVVQGRSIEIIDSTINTENLPESEVGEFMRIACLCTEEMSSDRPLMEEVVTLLNRLQLNSCE